MKKVLLLAAIAMFLAAPAFAAIKNTKHDLSSSSTSGGAVSNTDEVCVFCHTPHGANTAAGGPLWNRAKATTTVASVYSSPIGTMNAVPTIASVAASDALLCLTCHDGSSLATLTNPPNSLGATALAVADGGAVVSDAVTGNALIDNNFSNDHPIGFDFTTADGELNTKAAIEAVTGMGGALSYGTSNNDMYCSSCHDVHGVAGIGQFLRVNNAGSNLCLVCHIK